MKPLDILLGISVPLIWGMGIVFAKGAIEFFPPILLMALRFTVTALVLVWFVKPPWHLMGKLFVIALISAAIQYSLTFNGLKGLDASTAVLVIQLEVPFLVLLGALFLGERPGLKKWLGIAFAFLGVGVIYGEPKLEGAWIYLFLCMGGAFTWTIGQIMIRRYAQGVGAFTLIAWVAVMATPQLYVMSFALEENQWTLIREAGWQVWGTVAYLGLVMTALGYTIWYHLLTKHPVNKVGPFLLLLPVFSILGGIVVLGENLTEQIALGGAIVIVGVAAITIERTRSPAPEPAGDG